MTPSTRTAVAALAVLSIAALTSPARAQSKGPDDPTIVAIFDAANTWDMETGALGAARGTTKEVRDFGRMMVRDHRAVRQQGRDLAKRLGVHPTAPADTSMLADHHKAMRGDDERRAQGPRGQGGPRLPGAHDRRRAAAAEAGGDEVAILRLRDRDAAFGGGLQDYGSL